MATPRVFISSTCYDLKYIRENIKYFVKTLGYEPILSEDGDVFYDPKTHTHEACIAEVPNTQIFILIIGGRFGGAFKGKEHSITNAEYREAVKHKIPVFTLVETGVYNDHHLFTRNKTNEKIDADDIDYPSVDSVGIFKFIDEVRQSSVNNAVVPFNDFADIESYLKSQWAGMLHSFLVQENEYERIQTTFEAIKEVNTRVEMLSKQILASVGTDVARLSVKFYGMMINTECISQLVDVDISPTPADVVVAEGLDILFKIYGSSINYIGSEGVGALPKWEVGIVVGEDHYNNLMSEYEGLRSAILEQLNKANISPEEYVKQMGQIE